MKIKKISIKNIKSFKSEVVIEFDRSLNILIGPNGGGKSNLLSIITILLNHYFYKHFESKFEISPDQKTIERIQERQSFGNVKLVLEKYFGDNSDSIICITMQSEKTDYKNMELLDSYKEHITERINRFGSNYKLNFPTGWPEVFSENQDLEYQIINYNLIQPYAESPEFVFLYYLNNYHKFRWFTDDIESIELYSPIIFFPPSRTLTGNFIIEQQSLKQVDYFNRLFSISQLQSRSGNVSLAEIAVSHFGRKKRHYEKQAAKSRNDIADELFTKDEEVGLLSKYLKKIGYDWKIEEEESFLRYRVTLTKGSKDFDITKASSGEQEILNFLLGIFSLNVQGGVVIIDEPEIHLHPKWQKLLLEIISDLSATKNNQFIISTHSPTFVSPITYNHIIRVYKDDSNKSKIVVLKDVEPFELRDVLHIINGTNNEKMFFADAVILVEGITDRLVFSKIVEDLLSNKDTSKIVEIIEVKGKHNLDKYRRFLANLKIQSFFIADLDYINQIGTDEVKQLFRVDSEKIVKDVLKNTKSKDGEALVELLDQAISSNDNSSLTDLWEYIKSFRRKLKTELDNDEKILLEKFLEEREEKNIYVLREGDIEKYFMDGYKAKDLDNVIALLKEPNYKKWTEDNNSGFKKLLGIAKKILTKIEGSSGFMG